MQSIARTDTVNDRKKAINSLKKSTYWLENANLREYISKYWLNTKGIFLLFVIGKLLVGNFSGVSRYEAECKLIPQKKGFTHDLWKQICAQVCLKRFAHENNLSQKVNLPYIYEKQIIGNQKI